ncbi:MAG: alpha/beta hydrolase [Dehalococcoidia bacterium]
MADQTIRKGYVDTPKGQVHYRAVGEGDPVILLHMSPSSSAMWEAVQPRLAARGYRTVALDTPGYGDSFRPDLPPSLDDYADLLLEAIDGLGIGRFYVFGHHTGGMIGAALANRRPDRVIRFAVWGWTLMDEARKEELRQMPLATYDDQGSQAVGRWRARVAALGDHWTPQLGIRAQIDALKAGWMLPYGFWAVGAADHLALARGMTMPTLVMSGERDMIFEDSRQAVGLMPLGRFYHLVNGGVNAPDESPDELVETVDRFFREG